MKFKETRFDATGRVVIAILAVAALVIIGVVIAHLLRPHTLV
jgi:hypothetical protein